MKATQLELPLVPRLKVIQGLGQKKKIERLASRDAAARVLMEAGAVRLLRRISPVRAEAIEQVVEEILALLDRVESDPLALPGHARRLDALETLMSEPRASR